MESHKQEDKEVLNSMPTQSEVKLENGPEQEETSLLSEAVAVTDVKIEIEEEGTVNSV